MESKSKSLHGTYFGQSGPQGQGFVSRVLGPGFQGRFLGFRVLLVEFSQCFELRVAGCASFRVSGDHFEVFCRVSGIGNHFRVLVEGLVEPLAVPLSALARDI